MSAPRWRRGHHDRAIGINRAIERLAALGPEGGLWALLASHDPAGFLRVVADHIQELRDQLRASSPSTARDVPGPHSQDPQPETHP
jgi:hypothetical protein